MLKGAILGDQTWDKVELREGAMILMMGTKDEDMPMQPVEKTKYYYFFGFLVKHKNLF